MKKTVQSLLTALFLVILPACFNTESLSYPQLWIMACVGFLAGILQPSYDPLGRDAPSQDRNTALQIVWTCCLIQVLAVFEAVYMRYPESMRWDMVTSIVLSLMVLGVMLRTWAVITLGKFFTWHVTTQDGQGLVTHGPFRWLRHPSYTGALLIYLFAPAFLHSWWTFILGWIFLPLAFVRRVQVEEKALKIFFGTEYEKFCEQRARIFPGIW